jgi:beta-glucanase (GH16 family)
MRIKPPMIRALFILLFFVVTTAVQSQQPGYRSNYVLVWEDHFNYLNDSIWLVKNNFDHWGGEPQVYTSRPENVFIQDGHLVLRVDRETYSCPPEYINQWHCARQYNTGEPYEFTSGWIETRQPDFNAHYGWIEARIMLPYGYGFWPAFWTFRADDPPGGVNAAEIDIFEMLGHKPPNRITTNIHLEYCNEQQPDYPVCANIPSYYQENTIANYAYTYHTYAIEWSPSHLRWWIDDYLFRWDPNPGVVDPVRVILNMAIEPGYPPNETTPFPSDVLIDHVKVYSLVSSEDAHLIRESDLLLYPNPVRHQSEVNLRASGDLTISDWELRSSIGQVIDSGKTADPRHVQIETATLPSGYYSVRIQTSKGPATRNFIIH